MVTQVLIGWCAAATGRTPGEVIRRPALTLSDWLDESGLTGQA